MIDQTIRKDFALQHRLNQHVRVKPTLATDRFVERNGSGVELQTLDYENPVSNPVLR